MAATVPQPQHLVHPPLNLAINQIRLLQILEGGGSSRICCTLATYNVADATPYIALSYTWGSEDDSQIVYINGAEFRVRKNLFDFLLVARRSLCKSLFWIDQICIDQDNVRERNHQVALMSEIYTNAHSVTAWLGVAGEDSDLAMDLLYELDTMLLGTFSVTMASHPSRLRNITPRLRNALQKLFRRPYWSRLWIVQEIKLAKEVVVRCGTRKVFWRQILSTIKPLCEESRLGLGIQFLDVPLSARSEIVSPATRTLFMDDQDVGFYRQYGDENTRLVSTMETLFGKQRDSWRQDGAFHFLRMIYMYCEFECADIRDKVYGLLGLYPGCPVEIDYDKNALDLYWEIVRMGLGTEFNRASWLCVWARRLDDLIDAWSYFYVRLSIHIQVDTPEVLRATSEALKTVFAALHKARAAEGICSAGEYHLEIDEPCSEDLCTLQTSTDVFGTLDAKLMRLWTHLKELERKKKRVARRDSVLLETPPSCTDVHMPRFESDHYVGENVEGFGKETGALTLRTLDFGFTDPNVRDDPNERCVIR